MLTFAQTAATWLDGLESSLADNTKKAYAAHAHRCTEIIGETPLEEVHNSTFQHLVSTLKSDDLAATTIRSHVNVAKMIVESVCDEKTGDPLYPIRLRHKYVGTPKIRKRELRTPVAMKDDVERGIHIGGSVGAFVALAAATGMRISEILALEIFGAGDSWNPNTAMIRIQKTLKTDSAAREIPLTPEMNSLLIAFAGSKGSGKLFPVTRRQLIHLLKKNGLPPAHAYRRFRTTHARKNKMVEETLKRVLGHSLGSDVTDGYSHASDDLDFVRSEVNRIGLGFAL